MSYRALLLGAVLCVSAQASQTTQISEFTEEVFLSNGMKLLLVHQEGQPMTAAGWVAHVGSVNERPGITGISHLFEHMLFKGSPRIGTRDFATDQSIREQLDALREQIFDEERALRQRVRRGEGESLSDPELETERLAQLRAEFAELIAAQRDVIVKDEFDKVYTEAGATSMNAFTTEDLTGYFIKVPQNKLELWFWMESERLYEPVFREFYSERDVVYEERRMRTEATPTGQQNEVFNSLFWRGHPYGWPVVGWPSDISSITRAQAENFLDLYYAPQNITLAIVGDFDREQVLAWAEQYFGRIPKGRKSPPDVVTLAMPLEGELIYRAEVEAPPSALVAWHTTAFNGADDPALQVLASVLSGKTGRLYKRLVLEEEVATGVNANADAKKYDGRFMVSANGKQGVSPDRLRELLLEEVTKVAESGITAYELEKVKNQLTASQFRRLRDPFFLMIQLIYFDGLDEWKVMDTYFNRILAVEADEVQAVAQKYLGEHSASRLYTRIESDQPMDPELAALSAEQQAQVEQMLSQIRMAPPEQMGMIAERIEASMAQVPEEMRPVMSYLLKKVREMTKEGE